MRIRSSSSERKKRDRAGVALASGAPAKLVVDAARFVALGADDVQAAGADDFLVLGFDDALGLVQLPLPTARRVASSGSISSSFQKLARHKFRVAAEQDVRAAPGHVGGDGDRAFASGLRDDLGFALVIFRVQDVVRDADLLQASRDQLGVFDRDRADQRRLPFLVHSLISSTTASHFSGSVR